MTCAACGADGQPGGAKFCSECGTALAPPSCSSCQARLTPGAKFCSECGAPQQHGAPAAAAPAAARRVTSVLFGDLVGFTSLSESRDSEDVRELLSRYFEECRQIVDRYGGTVEKFIGDAVMAVWGVPTAHEDDAERSVRAGLELVNRIEAMGSDLGAPDLAMRVGIVTGEVAVTIGAEAQGMVAGDAVNTAARVQSAATPGQVWVDETTRLLTSSAISYVDVGSHAMKGKADPVPLWAVRAVVAGVGGSQRADGLEATHVGRDRELRLVKDVFHGIEETKRPALLVVDGEAGAGKSRLAWEFEKYVDGLTYVARWHHGRCLSYGEGVAYYALAEAIRARLQGLRPEADPAGAEEADADEAGLLALGLDRYVPDPEERAWLGPRLGALLGIGAPGSHPREDLFAAWATFLHRVSEDEHAVVLVIDDAQHADDSLLQFLEYLLGVGSFPCLVVLLTRPGLLEANPTLATNRRATVLHLEPLGAADMGRLLDGLVVGLPDRIRDSLVDRSEGIPLFAVETVRSLIDRDLVVPRGGQYVLADPSSLDLDALGAPATLQALIAARLDTLDAIQRRLVDRASVIDDGFTRDQISRLCPEIGDVDAVLAGLVRLQLLRQESSRFTTAQGLYQFVQGAVRQVAYATLSRHDRKAGHLAVVDGLRREDGPTGERASIVATHLLEALDAVPDASDVAELEAQAIAALREAATRAGALGAPTEAASHLAAALVRCQDQALAAQLESDLADQLQRAGDAAAAVGHAERATAAFDALGDPAGAALATSVWARALTALGRYDEAGALAEERYAAVRELGDLPHVELELISRLVSVASYSADAGHLELAGEMARLADYLGDQTAIAASYTALSLYYMRVGPRGLSQLLMEAAADVARASRDNREVARSLANLNADFLQDDTERAVEYGREALATGALVGDRTMISVIVLNLAMALLLHGEWDESLTLADDREVIELDAPYLELVRYQILRARGLEWQPGPRFAEQVGEQDGAVTAVRGLIEAMRLGDDGRPGVAEGVIAAAHSMHAVSGIYDDFTLVFVVATDLLWELGEVEGLAELVRFVDRPSLLRPPVGMQSQYHRVRALLAAHAAAAGGAEGDAAAIEQEFREAIEHAVAWKSAPWLARARADLAGWLSGQGRVEEAQALAAQARAVFDELGAVRWSAALEAALTGTRVGAPR